MTRYYKKNADGSVAFDMPTLADAIEHGIDSNPYEGELLSSWDGRLWLPTDTVPAKPADVAWVEITTKRDGILKDTQFRIAEDEPDRDVWLAYRAAVRAVTDQPDPFNIVWPVPPS